MADQPSGQLYSGDDTSFEAPPAAPAAAPDRDPDTGRFTKPSPIPPALARQARAAGLDDADLAEMTPAEVREHLSDHKWNSRLEQVFALRERGQEAARAATPAAPAGVDWGTGEDGSPLKESDWPPRFARLFRDLEEMKAWKAQVESHLSDLPQLKQYVRGEAQAKNESFARRMERFYARHPEVYGRGTLAQLDKADDGFRETPEFYARMQTFAAWKKAGADPDELEDTLEREHAARFGAKAAPRDDARAEADEWEEGVLGRPTQRGLLETPAGRDKAVQGVHEKLPQLNGRGKRPDRGAYLNPRS